MHAGTSFGRDDGFGRRRLRGVLRVWPPFAERGKARRSKRADEPCHRLMTNETPGIERVQEVHATLVYILWDLIHIALGEDDVI